MSLDQVVRWGILGSGKMSSDFARALKTLPEAQIVGVAARSVDSATRFLDHLELKGCTPHGSYDALVQDPNIDVVYIGTIHPCHASHAILALRNNKHVLCEKPFAVNAREAKEVALVAREQGRFVMEAMWTRFFPAYRQVHEWVKSGAIGEVMGATGDFGFACDASNPRMWSPETAGGGLLDIGVYPLSFAVDLVGGGRAPDDIKAHGVIRGGVDASATISLRYGNKLCSLFYTLDVQSPEEWIVLGSNGRIKISGMAHTPTEVTLIQNTIVRGETKTETKRFELSPFDPGYNYPNSQGLVYEAQAVHQALASGLKTRPEMTLDETLVIMGIMDEVRAQLGVVYPSDTVSSESQQ